jgi:hypothetical protein
VGARGVVVGRELALSFSMGNSSLRVGNFGRTYFGVDRLARVPALTGTGLGMILRVVHRAARATAIDAYCILS